MGRHGGHRDVAEDEVAGLGEDALAVAEVGQVARDGLGDARVVRDASTDGDGVVRDGEIAGAGREGDRARGLVRDGIH